MSKKLTAKQDAFVREYLIDLDATQAAIRAGYSEKTAYSIGSENLRKPEIAKAIQEAMARRNERTELTQDYVINGLMEVAERSLQRRPVFDMRGNHVKDDEGNHLWQFNAQGANKAFELLGKHQGMFVSRHDHTTGGEKLTGVMVAPTGMTQEEWEAKNG